MNGAEVTSKSLLLRMRDPTDELAWEEFTSFYSPIIVGFLIKRGCNMQLAMDTLQETLVMILKIMPTFEYDPQKGKFRSFLLRVVDRRRIAAFRREKKYVAFESESKLDWLEGQEDTSAPQPGVLWDQLWQERVFGCAMERVKQLVKPLTYQSFQLYVIEQVPMEQVLEQLGIADRNTVYQHKNRMMKLLKKEVEILRGEFGE